MRTDPKWQSRQCSAHLAGPWQPPPWAEPSTRPRMKGLSKSPGPHHGGPSLAPGRGLPLPFEKRAGPRVLTTPQSHTSGLPSDKAGHDATKRRRGDWKEMAHSLPCGSDATPPLILSLCAGPRLSTAGGGVLSARGRGRGVKPVSRTGHA